MKQFSWGAFFRGTIFLGGLFPWGNFQGSNFLGGIFTGAFFRTPITTYLYYWISAYLISLIKSIAKSIYFKLLVNIPEQRYLGHVFLSFSPKLIESHKRIRLVMNFS